MNSTIFMAKTNSSSCLGFVSGPPYDGREKPPYLYKPLRAYRVILNILPTGWHEAGLVLTRILISNTSKKKIPFGPKFHVPKVFISTPLRLTDDYFWNSQEKRE